MAIDNKNPVSVPCKAYMEMLERWELIDDLRGGTLAMRKAGQKWLPQEPKEDKPAYNNRLHRSVLFEAYKDTCEDLAGRPFSRDITINGELGNDRLEAIQDNCDKNGTTLTQFARECLDTLIDRGLTHILVDYPAVNTDGVTLSDEQENDIRPYFVHIKPESLIGWKYSKDQFGRKVLTQIRWKETVEVDDGDYGTKTVDRIRVFTTKTWEIHEKDGNGNFHLVQSGTHTFGAIPLVTCYINKTGFMTAVPAMEPLAWANLDHWQQNSDLKNAYRYLSWPILFLAGLSAQEVDTDIIIGPGRKVVTTNPDADGKYIEHSGASVDSCRQGVLDIEERMVVLGLEPLLSKPGDQTATGQSIDESKSQSCLQSWIRSLAKALRNAYELGAKWINAPLPEDFDVVIYSDFGISVRASQDIDALIRMRQAREIDRMTFLREVKRRGVVAENTDIEEIASAVEAEGPELGMMDDSNPGGGNADE